jgi:L-iditol 2-dehydrogenase
VIDSPTHRVVACGADGSTRLEELPVVDPEPGELVLALSVCGLCGTDLFKLAQGPAAGRVLGHELVGRVLAAGDGVDSRFAPGTRVVVPHHVACGTCDSCRAGNPTLCAVFRQDLLQPGGFSERILVRRRAVERAARVVPDSMPDEVAVFLEPAACVLRGVERSGIGHYVGDGKGRAVGVLGGGSMGLLHLLVLRSLYPRLDVLLSDPMVGRRELAERLGAIAVAPESALERARDLRGGAGLDAVFDTVGGQRLLEQALALTREGGTVVLFAHAPPDDRAGFDLNAFFKAERQVAGTYSGALAEQDAIWRLLVEGSLDPSPLVTHRLPLARFDEAVGLMRRREALKVLLTPDRETGAT